MINEYKGEKFLNRLYKDLHMSDEVMHTATPSDSKDEKVHKYLERLEKVENMARESKYNGMKHLKNLYYRKYVIKPENVPESYFELQKKIALERGFGHIDINDTTRKEMISTITEEQKKSLDTWLDYLMSKDAMYPEWFKYYAFQGMLKLGSYDKEKGVFNKRTGSTTNIFVDLNREALALTYDNLCKVLGGKSIDEDSLQKLIENGSFAKIYGYLIKKLDSKNKELLDNNDGMWIKYDKGSKPDKLVNSLQGKGTGWCTAGYETAKKQLQGGDFHVYYTKDRDGNYSQPRIAIRMEGSEIGEIRGIAEHQNMESEMGEVLSKKLEEFPDKEEYIKKVQDMEILTKIYKEYKDRELTKEEISFLYEVDDKILGFGYRKDPRVKEILDGRDLKKDLSFALDCKEDEISNEEQDVLDGKKIVYFYDNLELLELESSYGLTLPQIIGESLYLGSLTSVERLTFPQIIGDSLYLYSLTSAEGLTFPQSIGGNLYLGKLTSAEGLTFPQIIGESLYLDILTSAEGLTFPQSIGENLFLNSLTSAKGLTFPQSIGENLFLNSLTSAKGLTFPQIIGEDLDLSSLTSAEGLTFPQSIGGNLYLGKLTSAKGLTFPQIIGDSLYLDSLTSAKGLTFPQIIGEDLDLSSLTSAEGLVLPQTIGGDLNLSSLASAEGLVLPQTIGGSLYLSSLISAEGLVLPQTIGGNVYLSGLANAEGLVLPKTIEWSLYLNSLTSLDGVIVPENFKCYQLFSNYITKEDLIKKSLEQSQVEENHKHMGFSNIYILALFAYVSSLILTLIGFLILK